MEKKKDWNIVDGEMMREIINCYFFSPEFENKVLEFKRARMNDFKFNVHFYLSAGIKPANYPQWTRGKDDFLSRFATMSGISGIPKDELSKMYDDFINKGTSLVVMENNKKPVIIPVTLGRDDSLVCPMIYDLFGPQIYTQDELETLESRYHWLSLGISKASMIGLWFYMDEETGRIYSSETIDPEGKCKFNIRSISLNEWEEIAKNYEKPGAEDDE